MNADHPADGDFEEYFERYCEDKDELSERERLDKIKWTADTKRDCLRNPWVSSREQGI